MTTKEQSLERLIERVKAATDADRHLDALIEVEARRQEAYRVGLNDQQRAHWTATMDGVVYDSATRYDAPAFTASIDAVLALVERCLPGCEKTVISDVGAGDCRAAIWSNSDHDGRYWPARTMPLAILAALLSALKDASE